MKCEQLRAHAGESMRYDWAASGGRSTLSSGVTEWRQLWVWRLR